MSFKCTICPFSTAWSQNLKDHIDYKHGNKKKDFPCDKCDMSFENNGKRQRHIDTVHNSIRHYCNFCPFSYARKDHLTSHVKKKHAEQNSL